METTATSANSRSFPTTIGETVTYIQGLMAERPHSLTGRGMEMGLHAVIAQSALRRLPAPLNLVVPMVVEKVILKHGVEEGRELLIKGLKWVKKVTDEDPAIN